MKALLIFFPIVFCANSCATDYSCGQYPESGCQPVSTVYKKTNNGFHDYRVDLYDKNKGKENQRDNFNIDITQSNQALAFAAPGDPILTKPIIMRILFNSWLDSEADLNTGGYVYVRIKESKWVVESSK